MRDYTYLDLFRYKSLRWITISSCVLLLYLYMLYYTTQYSLGQLKGDIYVTALVVALCETGSLMILTYFIQDVPRKKYSIVMLVACMIFGSMFFIVEYVETPDLVVASLAGVIRIFNCAGQGIAYIYVEQLFPTSVRALGVGKLIK